MRGPGGVAPRRFSDHSPGSQDRIGRAPQRPDPSPPGREGEVWAGRGCLGGLSKYGTVPGGAGPAGAKPAAAAEKRRSKRFRGPSPAAAPPLVALFVRRGGRQPAADKPAQESTISEKVSREIDPLLSNSSGQCSSPPQTSPPGQRQQRQCTGRLLPRPGAGASSPQTRP